MYLQDEQGFSLTELLVGIALFGIVGLSATTHLVHTFRKFGVDNRASIASQELRNAANLLAAELRMSASVSPYIPGNDYTVITCGSGISVDSDSIKFLVIHDDADAPSGITAYYVGYRYDPIAEELLRGEIPSANVTNADCSLPAGDPTAEGNALVLAQNVTPIDIDGDNIDEPIFSYTSPELLFNLGIQIEGQDSIKITQPISMEILARTL